MEDIARTFAVEELYRSLEPPMKNNNGYVKLASSSGVGLMIREKRVTGRLSRHEADGAISPKICAGLWMIQR